MLQHSWLQIEIFNKNNFEAVKSKRRPRKRTCPFLQEAVSESPPLEVIMRVLVQVCFLHSWWRSDLTGSLCSTAFFKVNFQGALKMHLSVSVTPRTKSSKHQPQDAFGKKWIFLFSPLKSTRSKLAISLSVSVLSCAHQMPLTSLQCPANPCQQPFLRLLTATHFCELQELKKILFQSVRRHSPTESDLLSYHYPKLDPSIMETSCSPWTACLLEQALTRCLQAASFTRLLSHRLCIFRYDPEFLAGHLLADRCPYVSDASIICISWKTGSYFMDFFFPLNQSPDWNATEISADFSLPQVVSAVFIALRHQTVLLITVNPFSLWLAQVVLWLTR